MPSVKLKHDKENFESLLRRFKRACDDADIIRLVREREYYEKPTTKRKKAKAAAEKRAYRDRMNDKGPNSKKRLY